MSVPAAAPATIAFADLPTPPHRAVDVVSLRLVALLATQPPASATNWRRRILVLCARQMSVSGTSLAVLALDDAALTSGIARILMLTGSLQSAADLLDSVIATAEAEYKVSHLPPTDFTPLPSGANSSASTPSPQPIPPTAADPAAQQQFFLAAVAAMGHSMGQEIARQFSSSLSRPAPSNPALESTLARTLDAQRKYFSSSLTPPEEGGYPGLGLEFRWPSDHADLPVLHRALAVFAAAVASLQQNPPAATDRILQDLRSSGRALTVEHAAALALHHGAPSHFAVAELAVLADRTLPESAVAVLRLARVARPRTAAEVTAARRGEYVQPPPALAGLPIREPRRSDAQKPARFSS